MIRFDRDDGLWTATIARPDKANSLTGEMLAALAEFAEAAAREARVLVLTGEGKVFSAGADLDEARAGLAGMIAVDGDPSQSLSQNAFGGINLGVRAQSPTRVAPFVGAGVFAGASSYYELADSDGVDNDDDFFIDEPGEERETNDYFAAVYPEVGVHAWLTSNWRATASASYLVTTEGRDHDFWYVGVYLARLMQPPTFSGKDGVTLDAWGGEIPEPQLLRLPPP